MFCIRLLWSLNDLKCSSQPVNPHDHSSPFPGKTEKHKVFLLGWLYIFQYFSLNQQLRCKWSLGRMDACEALVWDTCSQKKDLKSRQSNLKGMHGRWSQRKKENSLFPCQFWDRCDGFGAAVSTAERETSHNRGSFPRLLATFRGILGCSQKILLRGVLCPSANPQPAFWPWIAISSKQSDQTTKLSSTSVQLGGYVGTSIEIWSFCL